MLLALLAKRAWQLIENLDSLCAMVLQERYYPSGDPLNADAKKVASIHGRAYVKGSKPSRIKRSYVACHGNSIDIWRIYEWIPHGPSRRIITIS